MVRPNELYDLTDQQLLDRMGSADPESAMSSAVRFEFERRTLIATREAAKAQIDAAEAAKKTAVWTRVSALAIAASVLVMAIAPFLGKQ